MDEYEPRPAVTASDSDFDDDVDVENVTTEDDGGGGGGTPRPASMRSVTRSLFKTRDDVAAARGRGGSMGTPWKHKKWFDDPTEMQQANRAYNQMLVKHKERFLASEQARSQLTMHAPPPHIAAPARKRHVKRDRVVAPRDERKPDVTSRASSGGRMRTKLPALMSASDLSNASALEGVNLSLYKARSTC